MNPNPGLNLARVLGLALLYTSTFYLPLLTSSQAYLLMSRNLFTLVLVPTLIATAIVSAAIVSGTAVIQRWCASVIRNSVEILAVSIMVAIALGSVAEVAGYHWQDLIPRGPNLLHTQHIYKYSVLSAVVCLVALTRRSLSRWIRSLTSLGFAFAALGIARALILSGTSLPVVSAEDRTNAPLASIAVPDSAKPAAFAGGRTRRVVWIIFDETDYRRVFAPDPDMPIALPHFKELSQTAVFATHAGSPASATLYSIPALLTGVAIEGEGIHINTSGRLSLQSSDHGLIPFTEETSLFGALARRGKSASILGFLHPYCALFKLSRCDSFTWPAIGGWSAALWANLPDSVSTRLRRSDDWENITRRQLELLPSYLSRDDALTFVHLNVPHLTAAYADEMLHLPPSPDPLVEYSRNLRLADRILGDIMRDLRQRLPQHELLLVVSTDHWLRNRWYQADKPEVPRPIPLILWKVGEADGVAVTQPLSTFHTAEIILQFLDGAVTDQSQIAKWWTDKSVFPPYIAPHT